MSDNQQEEWVKLAILLTVTAVWAITFLFDAVSKEFTVPSTVHGLMATVLGYYVGSRFSKKKNNGK